MIRKNKLSSCLDNHKKTGVWADGQGPDQPHFDASLDEYYKKALMEKTPTICGLAKEIHRNALDHGWWEDVRPIPELLCMIHSEVSEALEAYRKDDFDNLKEELADIMIRVMDMAEGYGIDIESEIIKKHAYNKTRSYKHGGKVC